MVKTCYKCGVEFTPSPGQLKRFDYRCSLCENARHKKWRSGNRKREIARCAAYRELPGMREKRAEWARIKRLDPQEAYKNRARHVARHAVASGRLARKPCEVCGLTKTEAHHDDYDKPLEVRWLCAQHHADLHRMRRET
jgi:hypothetical protein